MEIENRTLEKWEPKSLKKVILKNPWWEENSIKGSISGYPMDINEDINQITTDTQDQKHISQIRFCVEKNFKKKQQESSNKSNEKNYVLGDYLFLFGMMFAAFTFGFIGHDNILRLMDKRFGHNV